MKRETVPLVLSFEVTSYRYLYAGIDNKFPYMNYLSIDIKYYIIYLYLPLLILNPDSTGATVLTFYLRVSG